MSHHQAIAWAVPAAFTIRPGLLLFRGFLDRAAQRDMLAQVRAGLAAAPPFQPVMPRTGKPFSVRMSNFGPLGWVSDRQGYRYQPYHPETGAAWPAIPEPVLAVWRAVAEWPGEPEACLVNLYGPQARMGLHQDRDEKDLGQPIVSLSLGLPAVFLFGGAKRNDSTVRVPLAHGDFVVWGGASRLRFHGVLAVRDGWHPMTGACRVNVTFRRASG